MLVNGTGKRGFRFFFHRVDVDILIDLFTNIQTCNIELIGNYIEIIV